MVSCCIDGFVDLALVRQPIYIFPFGAVFYFPQKLNRFSFVARFTRIVDGDDHLHFYCNHVFVCLHQPRPFRVRLMRSPGIRMVYSLSKKCTVTSLATPLSRR